MKRWLPLFAAFLVPVAGCAVGPDFHRPGPIGPERYVSPADPARTTEADGVVQTFTPERMPPGRWWTLFGSSSIDALVDQGLRDSPNIAAAQAALRESQARLLAGAGVFYPTVDVQGSATKNHESGAAIGLPGVPRTFSLLTASASISYALDIFGGERRTVEGLRASRDAQADLVGAAYLSLTSNIVNTVIAATAYDEEARVVRRMIAFENKELAITRQRVAAALDGEASLMSLEAEIASNEALVPALEQKKQAAEDLLATLVGAPTGAWTSRPLVLADIRLPADLPLTVPSRLVRQRPDVLYAEAELHAANAQIGVATAALLPSVTLGVAYGGESDTISRMFTNAGSIWSAGATVTAPVFNGGTLWQNRKAAVASKEEAFQTYRATVLAAFEQVADTLRGLGHDAEIVTADERAVRAAGRAQALGLATEQAGMTSALAQLIYDIQYQQAQLQLVEARAQRLQDTVALYAALGGGWESSGTSNSADHATPTAASEGQR